MVIICKMNGVLDLRYRARYCILTTKQKRGITFALKRSVFPGGGSFSFPSDKAAKQLLFWRGVEKTSKLVFLHLRQKKDTDFCPCLCRLGNWRREGDSNPRNPKRVQRFSRPPRSTAPASLRVSYLFFRAGKGNQFYFLEKNLY